MTFAEGGAIAEAFLTSYLLIKLSKLKKGDICLVYAAASGIGLTILQLCQHYGILAIASCSADKMDFVREFTPHVIDRGLDLKQ
jgi:tumor protein p53-inducible protein 3